MMANLFGTDGIRKTMGTSPLTLEELPRLGYALAQWIIQTYGNNTHVLLAHDTRISCSLVKSALTSGLLLHPLTIHDAHILPTPAVCKLVYDQHAAIKTGIIISASHNHYTDNGIKIITHTHGKITFQEELTISSLFTNTTKLTTLYTHLGSSQPFLTAAHSYITAVLKEFSTHLLHGVTVVLDCAHGATSSIAPEIFRSLGAHVITINKNPDGTNINHNCGALFPGQLQQEVINNHADIGFAFDGDGDRVVAVSRTGIVKNGDDLLALLSNHPRYQHEQIIVGTIMSNEGLVEILHNNNKSLIRVDVGDKYVTEKLEQENLLLGGEQSGHIVMRDYLNTGDGIFTALRVTEAIIVTNNWDMLTFTQFPQILINLPVTQKKNLQNPVLARIIEEHKQQLPYGRIEVRYSGTENILRIMVEDNNYTHAHTIGTQLSLALQKTLTIIGDPHA